MMHLFGQTLSGFSNALATAAQTTSEQAPPTATPATGAAPNESPFGQMLPLLAIIAVFFYLVVLRPQKREKQQRQQMLDSLKKGDKVVTIGGMHGKVADIDEVQKTVSVEVAPKVVVKYSRAAVQSVEPRGGAQSQDKDKSKDDVEPSK